MKKLDRFVAKHSKGATGAAVGLWCGLSVLAQALWDWPLLPTLLVYFAGVFSCLLFIGSCYGRLLKVPMEAIKNDCDPYPYLQETWEQMTYSAYPSTKQMITMNHALALQMAGELEKAQALLESINIDKYRITAQTKVAYYNNRADLCFMLGQYQEADIWYTKTVQLFHDLKPGKMKEQLRPAIEANRALHHFCIGEYERTLQVLSQAKPKYMAERVENAMMYGRTYLALGEPEKAKKPLRFVAENGNKLYFATEAKELLTRINMEETKL
jgi:tetratricopeptide (TPR) repeat protein